jgi:hypothetical protein
MKIKADAKFKASTDPNMLSARGNRTRMLKTTKKCRRCDMRLRVDHFAFADSTNRKRVRVCNSCRDVEDQPRVRNPKPTETLTARAREVRNRTLTYARAQAHPQKIEYPAEDMAEHLLKIWYYKCAVCTDPVNRFVIFTREKTMAPYNAVPLCKDCCNKDDHDNLDIPEATSKAINDVLFAYSHTDVSQIKYVCPVPTKDCKYRFPSGPPSKQGLETTTDTDFMFLGDFCTDYCFTHYRWPVRKLVDRPLVPIYMNPEIGVYRVSRFRTEDPSDHTETPLAVVLVGSPYFPDKAWGIVHSGAGVCVASLKPDTLVIDKVLFQNKSTDRVNFRTLSAELLKAVTPRSPYLCQAVSGIASWLHLHRDQDKLDRHDDGSTVDGQSDGQ